MTKGRVHILIYGRVQGVFFRAWTEDKALELRLKGWVRNNPDGTVEVVAEGSEKDLETLISWCRKGPPDARVERIEITREPYRGDLGNFSVVRYLG